MQKQIGNVRERTEMLFGRWAMFVFHFRWPVVLGTLIFVGLLAPQLAHIRVETSVDGVLTEDDPHRIIYENFRHQFGRDERLLLLIDAGSDSNGVFDIDFLSSLEYE